MVAPLLALAIPIGAGLGLAIAGGVKGVWGKSAEDYSLTEKVFGTNLTTVALIGGAAFLGYTLVKKK